MTSLDITRKAKLDQTSRTQIDAEADHRINGLSRRMSFHQLTEAADLDQEQYIISFVSV
jgi:hypothetical protein